MERRRSQRVPVQGDRYGRVKATVPARIVDISQHGVQLEMPAALRPAVECDLTLPFGSRNLRIRARVQRCRVMGFSEDANERKLLYRAGLEFVSVAEDDRDPLFQLVQSLPGNARSGTTEQDPESSARVKIDSAFVRRRQGQ